MNPRKINQKYFLKHLKYKASRNKCRFIHLKMFWRRKMPRFDVWFDLSNQSKVSVQNTYHWVLPLHPMPFFSVCLDDAHCQLHGPNSDINLKLAPGVDIAMQRIYALSQIKKKTIGTGWWGSTQCYGLSQLPIDKYLHTLSIQFNW